MPQYLYLKFEYKIVHARNYNFSAFLIQILYLSYHIRGKNSCEILTEIKLHNIVVQFFMCIKMLAIVSILKKLSRFKYGSES